ncbi:M57 family metalloprotease [Algoriphagus sediminis]|uniref:M57 family metalloprotease n=1 Tax=Algoriphagus sediminis TaxID=3057113 RepID=A0ABT7YD68_9BACT|nr:M57 family metalloprotease [Algoriphagus sediminis]MDN3204149.1 M57 family metalloprotease [Algoriphagus sediminis]
MKTTKKLILSLFIVSFCISCQVDEVLEEQNEIIEELPENEVEIDPRFLEFLEKSKIVTKDIQRFNDGYIIGGDVLVTDEKLNEWWEIQNNPNYQSKTVSIVSVPNNQVRTITYRFAPFTPIATQVLVNDVMAKYNSIRNFNLKFQQTTSTNQDLLISMNSLIPGIGLGSWPFNGNIGDSIELDPIWFGSSSNSDGQKKFVIAHEIGHCIGFRHGDWAQAGEGLFDEFGRFIGAELIPATFEGDPFSIYNSGPFYNSTVPNFTDWYYTDLLAIRFMYSKDKTEKPFYSYISTSTGWANWTTNWNTYGYGNLQYGYWGVTGYIYSSPKPGSTTLYKYTHSSGTPYMSTTPNLHVSIPSFSYNGTLGHVFSGPGASRTPVYEWYNPSVGYFFTTNAVDNYVQGPGWIGGGIAFYAMSLGTL